jgi:hypothetical protein
MVRRKTLAAGLGREDAAGLHQRLEPNATCFGTIGGVFVSGAAQAARFLRL